MGEVVHLTGIKAVLADAAKVDADALVVIARKNDLVWVWGLDSDAEALWLIEQGKDALLNGVEE